MIIIKNKLLYPNKETEFIKMLCSTDLFIDDISHLPYLDNKQPIFQINVDLYNIPIGAEDMFSTIILYYALENILEPKDLVYNLNCLL